LKIPRVYTCCAQFFICADPYSSTRIAIKGAPAIVAGTLWLLPLITRKAESGISFGNGEEERLRGSRAQALAPAGVTLTLSSRAAGRLFPSLISMVLYCMGQRGPF
jgi:hypothetical protein